MLMMLAKATLLIALLLGIAQWLVSPRFNVPERAHAAILITGASTGIGKHASLHLDSLGYTVFAGVRKQRDVESLLAERSTIRPVLMDVGQRDSVDAAIDAIENELRGGTVELCGLVNNAGMVSAMPLELEDDEYARQVLEVNIMGVVRVTQAALPLLRRCKGGGARVVNVGSVSGRIALPNKSIYVASKHAVEGLSDALRLELAPQGISVANLQPAYVQTAIASKATRENAPWHKLSETKRRILEDHYGGVAEFDARAEDFLGGKWAQAVGPEVTSAAIEDAMTSAYPNARVAVAYSGELPASVALTLRWLLPDRFFDALLRAMGEAPSA